jgi:hypothetical protein
MAIDERQRSQLYERLASAVGEEAAMTMFELLPPPHSDVATTADIGRLEGRIDAAKHEVIAAFRGELVGAVAGQTKTLVAAIATTTVGIGGLAAVFSQLF